MGNEFYAYYRNKSGTDRNCFIAWDVTLGTGVNTPLVHKCTTYGDSEKSEIASYLFANEHFLTIGMYKDGSDRRDVYSYIKTDGTSSWGYWYDLGGGRETYYGGINAVLSGTSLGIGTCGR